MNSHDETGRAMQLEDMPARSLGGLRRGRDALISLQLSLALLGVVHADDIMGLLALMLAFVAADRLFGHHFYGDRDQDAASGLSDLVALLVVVLAGLALAWCVAHSLESAAHQLTWPLLAAGGLAWAGSAWLAIRALAAER